MKKFCYGVMILLLAFSFSACSNVGPVVKELKKINDESARYWIAFIKQNGIDAIDQNGNTILVMAVQSENLNMVKACMKSKANVNLTSKYGLFPITIAVLKDNIEVAEVLLKRKANVAPRPSENTLAQAISNGYSDMIDLLLKYKPDLDYRKSNTTLFVQGTLPPSAELLTKLEKAGYKPSLQDFYTYTEAYHYAQTDQEREALLKLIKKNAKDPVYRDFLPNGRDNVLTLQYQGFGTVGLKQVIPLFKVLLEAKIPPAPDRSNYNFAYQEVSELFLYNSNDSDLEELIELFSRYGIKRGN